VEENHILKKDLDEIIKYEKLFIKLSKSTVLITGISGLIGSMLVRALCRSNDQYKTAIKIIGVARDEKKVNEALGIYAHRDDLKLVYSETLRVDIPCDYIIHTASPTGSRFFVQHPVETIEASFNGTYSMLKLARKYNARMLYLSSMEQYGIPYKNGQIMTEDKIGIINHLTTRACYPESKRMCECLCKAFLSEYGVDVSISRLAQTFGAGAALWDNRVFMQFTRSVLHGSDIILHTSGRSMSNFCYLTDTITGLLIILTNGKQGEAYNICNDKETRSIAEVAQLVADKVGMGKIKVKFDITENRNLGYAPDADVRLCSEKLKGLGWIPKVTMEEAYQRLAAYLALEEKKNG